jgi:hypothetical protein
MGDTVRCVAGETFDLTLATNPRTAGASVELVALYGLDGIDVGVDSAGDALVLPVSMVEGAEGVYSVELALLSEGPFWARFSIGGADQPAVIIRSRASDDPVEDTVPETTYTVACVIPTSPVSAELGLFDTEAAQVGRDENGVAISWPQPMVQVPGQTDSWYYETVVFTEGGRVQVKVDPPSGPGLSDVIVVKAADSSAVLAHFDGWEPSTGLDPAAWASLYYIRRWTGWTTGHINDEDLRELRRAAVELFIENTGCWIPAWTGTFHSLRGQGSRLYLPVPILLPQDGGTDPDIELTEPWGDKTVVDAILNRDVAFRVRGRDARQPYLERIGGVWDPALDVKITATWGLTGIGKTLPIRVKQAIVGLIRWQSLSLGADADDARAQGTSNRVETEATRDARVTYHQSAIGMGVTGDVTVDRILAEYRIMPGPWSLRCGDGRVV